MSLCVCVCVCVCACVHTHIRAADMHTPSLLSVRAVDEDAMRAAWAGVLRELAKA